MANRLLTRNFILEQDNMPNEKDCLLDERTSILSADNTLDMEEYFNYLVVLNRLVNATDKRPNTGLLDLGFIPVIAPPSFFKDSLHKKILPILESKKIRYFNRPSVSFMRFNYTSSYHDVWVHKTEAAKFVTSKANKIHAITTREFLEAIL